MQPISVQTRLRPAVATPATRHLGGVGRWGIALAILWAGAPAFAQDATVDPSPISRDAALASGAGAPWTGTLPDGVNPWSRAKQTTLALFEFEARGGLPFEFVLAHSSKAVHGNPALGTKWLHNYDAQVVVTGDAGQRKAAVLLGDHTVLRFAEQGGSWRPLEGYRLFLLRVVSGRFELETPDHLTLAFEPRLFQGRLAHRLRQMADGNGNALQFEYDSMSRLVRVTEPAGRAFELVYDDREHLAAVDLVAGGMRWQYAITVADRRLARVAWPAVTTTNGVLRYEQGYLYDSRGNVVRMELRDGTTWQIGYDRGDPDAVAWIQAPGSAGSQRKVFRSGIAGNLHLVDELDRTVSLAFDDRARLQRAADGLGNATRFRYADPDNPWVCDQVIQPSGAATTLDYDATGRLRLLTNAAGRTWDFAWDARNNLVQVLEPLVTDAWGVTKPSRRNVEYAYDGADRLVAVRTWTSATTFVETTCAYDGYGQCAAVTDAAGQTTTFERDVHGNVIAATTPMGRRHEWSYESPGATFGFSLPNAMLDGLGRRGDLVRDELGRLVLEICPDGSGAIYAYDALDRLVQVVDPSGVTTWSYTPRGLVDSEMHVNGGVFNAVSHVYLANGRRSAIVEAGASGARDRLFEYDAAHRLIRTVDQGLPVDFAYDADGRRTLRLLPSGARSEYDWQLGNLAAIRHYDTRNKLLASYVVTRQADQQVMRIDELGGTVRYGYDHGKQLVREQRTGANSHDTTWSYDAVGNRMTQNRTGALTTYAYDLDRRLLTALLAGSAPDTFQWDQDGRLAAATMQGKTWRYSYGFAGRLALAEQLVGPGYLPAVQYAYDGLSRRIARQDFDGNGVPTTLTVNQWDGQSLLSQTRYLFGAPVGATFAGADGTLTLLRDAASGAGTWLLTDPHGSTRHALADHGRTTGYGATYDAFGVLLHESGNPQPFGFSADASAERQPATGFQCSGPDSLQFVATYGMTLHEAPPFLFDFAQDPDAATVPIELVSLSLCSTIPSAQDGGVPHDGGVPREFGFPRRHRLNDVKFAAGPGYLQDLREGVIKGWISELQTLAEVTAPPMQRSVLLDIRRLRDILREYIDDDGAKAAKAIARSYGLCN